MRTPEMRGGSVNHKKGRQGSSYFAARHEVNSNTSEQNWKIGRHPGLRVG
jgi:hypothetical protein